MWGLVRWAAEGVRSVIVREDRNAGLGAGLLASLFLLGGCLPHVDERVIQGPARDVGKPLVTHDQQATLDHVEATVTGDVVTVTAVNGIACRTTTTANQEHEVTKERSLRSGTLAQAANVVVAAGLIAAGAYVAANPPSAANCTPSATATDPNPQAGTCTAQEYSTQKSQTVGLGVALIAVGVLPAIAFGWNIVRAQDETVTAYLGPVTRSTAWQACGTRPAPSVELTLTVDGQTLRQPTDAQGVAQFDLSALRFGFLEPTMGQVASPLGQPLTVALSGTPFHARWAANNAAQKAQAQQFLQETQQRHEALKAVVSRMDAWAHSSIKVQWASAQHSETRCFNMVDFEVPCTSAAAMRKQESFGITKQATVTNTGRLALVCGQSGGVFGEGKTSVPLAPGRRATLPSFESFGLFLILGGSTDNTVACLVPTAALSQALGVDASVVSGRADSVLVGIIGSDDYVFTSSDKNDHRLFQWNGANVVEKTSDSN